MSEGLSNNFNSTLPLPQIKESAPEEESNSSPLENNEITTSLEKSPEESEEELKLTQLREKHSLYSHAGLKQRCEELGSQNYLIEGLLPDRSIGLLVGDSGLGKSPLVYQAGLCIASGKPFLGHPVRQGRVLVLDFENGLSQVDGILDGLQAHLGLDRVPEDDLFLWNINDAHSLSPIGMVEEVSPSLTIIDSLTGLYPDIEEKNKNATTRFQEFRKLMSKCGTSILALHHIRKPSANPEFTPPPLETCSNPRDWFLQTRGARALINGSDIRLGVDASARENDDIALVLRGFGRVKGEIPLTFLRRCYDGDGEPLGYNVASGVSLLVYPPHKKAFSNLPEKFRFKDAQQVYGKGAQATTDFLKICTGLGLIQKIEKEGYEKVKIAE